MRSYDPTRTRRLSRLVRRAVLRGRVARDSGRRRETGASAVEFALVSTVLFPLLFGIVDYGLWFADSLSARQAVRDAARSGVVQTQSCTAAGASPGLQTMACMAAQRAAPMAGKVWAKAVAPSSGWARGKPLVVCVMVRETGAIGLVPLPSNRIIKARTSMSIEVATSVSGSTVPAGSAEWSPAPTTAAPSDWGFCT